jgi:serine/threonine protein kinase
LFPSLSLKLGSPTKRIWPEIVHLPVIQNGSISLEREQLRFAYNHLTDYFPDLNHEGIEFLNAFFTYDPKLRITARDALLHDYFECTPYPKSIDFMPTFPTFHDELKSKNDEKEKK